LRRALRAATSEFRGEDKLNSSDSRKAAERGEPSYVWRAGQDRRLRLIHAAAGDRMTGRILDNGCGIGLYLAHLAAGAHVACGLEFDLPRATSAFERVNKNKPNAAISDPGTRAVVVCGAGEHLPFPDGAFDLILSHEVLEHVRDDRRALEEMCRVLQPPDPQGGKSGGRIILFVPNRGYPFETHGFYWRGKYHFGNIPLINYLPRRWRDRLAPHVRAYRRADLDRLFKGLPVRLIERRIIFGAYDNIIARSPWLGRRLRSALQALEHTPLSILGLSHLWVAERTIAHYDT
jgi:SAM-dependent methyltransferase